MTADEAVCAPGFEELAGQARRVMDQAGGGGFCVYLDGRPVLDLWTGVLDPAAGRPWRHDTMAMAWSTTKGIASTAIHMLADRDRLDYDALVSDYWPEFGCNGKQRTTVRHILAMEAGLYDIRHLIDDPRRMLDHQDMAQALARATPAHPPGQACGYHALTYGWLVGELVHRLTGHSLGAFIQAEIAQPLGLDGCHIGIPPGEMGRVASRPHLQDESRRLRAVAKAVNPLLTPLGFSPARMAAAFLPRRGHEVMGCDEFLAAEIPAANGVFTARSLARIYAALASDDGVDGIRLWSPETRRRVARQQNTGRDLVLALPMRWRLGYHNPFLRKRTAPGAFGFYGAYGSGAYADPQRGLAVGFVVRQAMGLPLPRLAAALTKLVDGQGRR